MNEICIISRGSVYKPSVVGEIKWISEKNEPSRLSFSVYGDGVLNFFEGDKVEFYHDGVGVFSGFVFTKKRDRENIITVTAYDSLRYLKNRDTYVYNETTAGELIKKILSDVSLEAGEIEQTAIKLTGAVEEEKPLIDIILRAVEADSVYSGKKYVLYDNFGKVCLKDEEALKSGFVIDETNTGNFNYSSSIDEGTYNVVKVRRKGSSKEVICARNDDAVSEWGILQRLETAEKTEDIELKAKSLVEKYSVKTRHITLEKVLGDLSVRAGATVFVSLNLGDIVVNEFFEVFNACHSFSDGKYVMDIVLKGGEFAE